jgi:hypothetical protein
MFAISAVGSPATAMMSASAPSRRCLFDTHSGPGPNVQLDLSSIDLREQISAQKRKQQHRVDDDHDPRPQAARAVTYDARESPFVATANHHEVIGVLDRVARVTQAHLKYRRPGIG